MSLFRIKNRLWVGCLISFLLMIAAGQAAEEKTTGTLDVWNTNFETAKQKAKEMNRPILVDFEGSDWCPPCMAMEERVYTQKAFLDYAKKNLVLLKLDFPRHKAVPVELQNQNDALAEKYNPDQAFPTVVLMDASGKEIQRMEGYGGDTASAFVEKVKAMLGKK